MAYKSGDTFEQPLLLMLQRDISACLELTSPEVVLQDLAHETPAMSQMVRQCARSDCLWLHDMDIKLHLRLCTVQGVAKFYSDLVSSMADNMCFVIEDMTVGDPYRCAHMCKQPQS
jgi:hypothetical protein